MATPSPTPTTAPSGLPPVLRIGLEEARNLLAADFNGFSDPYVQLFLLDHKGEPVAGAPVVKTAIKTKTLSPQWHESVTLGDKLDLRIVTTLRFLLLDFDGFKKDDTLGVVDIPMDTALQLATTNADEWFKVSKVERAMSKDATGELRLTFAAGAGDDANKTNKTSKTNNTAVPDDDDGSPNLLFVTIDSGRDLLPMDSNNLSDPCVKVSLTGQQFTTTTVEKTLKPHWDERFVFYVRDLNQTLDLVVEDEDTTVNDFLGRAQLVLADVMTQSETEVKLDLSLRDKKLQSDKDRGVLHVRLIWVYDEDAKTIVESMQKKQKKKTRSVFHQLTSKWHLSVPDAQHDDDDEIIARLNDAEGLLEDLSDNDEAKLDALPLPPGASMIRFAAVSIHRAEELPPLDALHFQKETHKPAAPGGGIDAYVAAWLTTRPEELVRTRIHTRKGRRDELSTSFHETLLLPIPADQSTASVTLAVMDWDNIGGDEVVSHIVLDDVAALAAQHGPAPFWWNLYGAPLVNIKDKDALDDANESPEAGSTYRGRVLLSLKMMSKPSTAYDAKPQKRSTSKLPRDRFPPSAVYRLRAHFVSAIGLPEPTGKYYVSLACGMHEITSAQKAAVNRTVEWNTTEESDRLLFPSDATQIPDVVLSLCTGEWEKRVVVGYRRFKAAQLLTDAFTNTAVEWVPLVAEPSTGAVKKNEFPGKVLLTLGFGPLASATTQVWDQKAMTDVLNRRVPYQVRVRVHGVKDTDGPRKTPVHLRVQCGDKEIVARGVVLDEAAAPSVFSLDVNLPQLSHAPQVLVHLQDDSAFVGTLAVSLQEATDLAGVDTTAIVSRCTSAQLKSNTRPQTPTAQWVPLLALDDSVEATRVLASVEIIRKQFPDEKLPAPETMAATVTP